jgi:HNH endonuclease
MVTRKAIPKSTRFEIFKRDAFTCQYCGGKAPAVLLHLDHIEPVAKGGTNDLLNLITSCEPCNAGKSDRRLGEHIAIEKKRSQLEELQERQEQLELMMQWQKGLLAIDRSSEQEAAKFWSELVPPFRLNESGIQSISKLLLKHPLSEVLEAMRTSVRQYIEISEGEPTQESVEKAWRYVAKICNFRKSNEEKPYLRDLLYIRGILRNRMYCDDQVALELLEVVHLEGVSIESLKVVAKSAKNWTQWRAEMEAYRAET